MKAVHVQLSYEGRYVCVFEILPGPCQRLSTELSFLLAYARTLENSGEGDMTKLSLEADQEIRLCMLRSSSMLQSSQLMLLQGTTGAVLVELVYESRLHHFRLL
jgi:hypothetical protein